MKRRYKLIDLDNPNSIFNRLIFLSEEAIRNTLIGFHSNNGDRRKLEKMSLNKLLKFGNWGIKES